MNTKPSSSSDQNLDPAFDDVYDDTDLGDDTWDDGADVEGLKPRKKKGGLFNLIVIVLGVVAFGGVIFMRVAYTPVPQAQQTTAPQTDEALQSPQETPAAAPVADATAQPATAADPLTPMPDFTATPDGAVSENTAAPDVAANGPTDTKTIADLDPALTTNVSDTPPSLTPPPVVSMTPNDAAPAVNPVPAEQTTVPAIPAVAQPTATPMADASVMAAPIDQARLQNIEDKLNTLATKLGEQQTIPAAAPSSTALADVQAKLDSLMARLETLEAKVAAAPEVTESAKTSKSEMTSIETPAAAAIDTTVEDADDQAAAEPVVDTAPTPAPVVKNTVSKTSRPKYMLRAVSRDKAYIASSQSAAVEGVAVGDTVPGWGTVRSITQGSNGRWQVVTDAGTIRQ